MTRFLLELTPHIPPRGLHYIWRYWLYALRSKGKWKIERLQASNTVQSYNEESTVSDQESRSTFIASDRGSTQYVLRKGVEGCVRLVSGRLYDRIKPGHCLNGIRRSQTHNRSFPTQTSSTFSGALLIGKQQKEGPSAAGSAELASQGSGR